MSGLYIPSEDCRISEMKLNLQEVDFNNNTIVQGWLKDLSRDVEELTIASSFLQEIGESAFAGKPFVYLNELVITDSRIRVLRKHAFINSKLQTFEFRCSNRRITIEHNALEPISNYLTILQLSQCIDDFQAVRNITGTGASTFNKLVEIDLRFNTFNNILNRSFIGAPQLISLYLSENNINSIELEAFRGIQSSLQLLSLRNNRLSTLLEGVFNGFTRGGRIDIGGNPWNCDCDLLWLKYFYIKNLELYFGNGTIPFTCTVGNYDVVEFCPVSSTTIHDNATNNNTITEATNITTTTGTTTENPYSYVYLQCSNVADFQDISLEGMNRIFSHSVSVRNSTILYNFFQIEGTPYFELKVMNNVGTDYLIWINSRNTSDYGCVHDIQESVQLKNLQYGMTYTICLLKEEADTVAPFDCTSLTVPLEWKNNAWILNKHIPFVIGGVIGIALAIILLTSLIMFYTIRQNPKLIKGNKRVVIVRNKSADALVMPNYERQQYLPPSIYTNSEGYLTPRNKMYDKINERRFRHLNTITEKFYNDIQATSSRNLGSCSSSVHRRSVGSVVYEPPPLPPNHPSEKLKKLSRSQSVLNLRTLEDK
ncbi:hypothetical protein NQ314_007747 [Rhamnusium bicolor]|uniref:Uncharacterized protein n=1 Tax=Rhamnusium bicolor TaxID=1586634 RepID=A0AAV8YH14_9CUCU|nr:hypothetical protein NQ314_007747 [Rhamnusium bicolor]